MIAAAKTQSLEEVCDLVRPVSQFLETEVCFGAGRCLDNPERRSVATFRIGGEFAIKPIESPVERGWVRPEEARHSGGIVGAMLKQERSCVLKYGHPLILLL